MKLQDVVSKIHFGHSNVGVDFVFCGVWVHLDNENYKISLMQVDYVHKVKPLTIKRRESPNDEPRPLDPGERRQFMGLVGAMQWPAAQSMPHAAASISILYGCDRCCSRRRGGQQDPPLPEGDLRHPDEVQPRRR